MTTTDSLRRSLEGQFRAWSVQDAEQKRDRPGPVITITREPGCGGRRIAQVLAKELGLVLYDGELVEEIAKDAHVSEQVVATLDEKVRSELDDWLSGFAGGPNLSFNQYVRCLRRVLFAIAAHGNAVILGRGANFLIPAERKTLGLCLVAPVAVREQNVAQELKCSIEEARKYIARVARERRLLVERVGHADIDDAANYHLVINTALVSDENLVRIVNEIVRPELAGSRCARDESKA